MAALIPQNALGLKSSNLGQLLTKTVDCHNSKDLYLVTKFGESDFIAHGGKRLLTIVANPL